MTEHEFRYTTLDDMTYLRDWLSRPGMLHWFPMSEGDELENAIQCWMGFCRYSCSLTATVRNQPCAIGTLFLMPYRKVAHHCLFKIIVAPEYQRKGIGSSLLKNLKHLAKTYFRLELMHIEVFEDNPMISLLLKNDFREFASQDRFVKEGDRYFKRQLFEVDL
jgi:putative acetyltransferase